MKPPRHLLAVLSLLPKLPSAVEEMSQAQRIDKFAEALLTTHSNGGDDEAVAVRVWNRAEAMEKERALRRAASEKPELGHLVGEIVRTLVEAEGAGYDDDGGPDDDGGQELFGEEFDLGSEPTPETPPATVIPFPAPEQAAA